VTDTTTARLVLHPLTPAEAARIIARTPDAGDRWHVEYPFEDELAPLSSLAAAPAPDPVFTLYQVRETSSGLAIGGIGFFGPPDADGAVELGYGLVAAARGRGYATEALIGALGIAAAHGARLVRADTELTNTASQGVLTKAGFTEVRRNERLVFCERTVRPDRDPGRRNEGSPRRRARRSPGTDAYP
jgi:RimJ/RimL family protein N-acetyltransferase